MCAPSTRSLSSSYRHTKKITYRHKRQQDITTVTHKHTRAHTLALWRTIISESQTVPMPGITTHSPPHTQTHRRMHTHKRSNPKPRLPVILLRHPQRHNKSKLLTCSSTTKKSLRKKLISKPRQH